MKTIKQWGVGLILTVGLIGLIQNVGWTKKKFTAEGEYYTTANIWFEHPEKIVSTNYHRGTIIPLGTKVTVRVKKANIYFTPIDDKVTYTLIHYGRHSRISTEEFFNRYFSKENIMQTKDGYNSLTKKEKELVKKGEIEVGMTKKAVLMSYGYPPSHKTPKLDGSVWNYWRNRADRRELKFEGDKLVHIRG